MPRSPERLNLRRAFRLERTSGLGHDFLREPGLEPTFEYRPRMEYDVVRIDLSRVSHRAELEALAQLHIDAGMRPPML